MQAVLCGVGGTCGICVGSVVVWWYVADKSGIGIGGLNTHTSRAAARKKGLFNHVCTDTVK